MISKAEDGAISASLILLFGGIAVFLWQVYGYLRYNTWMPISIITLLEWMKIVWAYNPNDWIGFHSILKHIPLSAAMIAAAWMVISSVN